jgi:diguanylate cyclase (GGDEF)-like protein
MSVLLINLAVGLIARQQQHAIMDFAIDVYDTAFVSTNYVHLAQKSFENYANERLRAVGPDEISRANQDLERVLTELDVAIERSASPPARTQGLKIRTNIVALTGAEINSAELPSRLSAISQEMDKLADRNSAVGLKARDDIEAFSHDADLLLLLSVVTSILLAGLALVALQGLIARIVEMASYDSLTGLPNRSQFRTRMIRTINSLKSEAGTFAVLSLDLDRFKSVNDTLGHHTGDLLLIEAARRIEKLLPKTDMAARFGGDEFVILQTAANASDAGILAQHLIAALCAPYTIHDQQILIGVSVGIALAPENGMDADSLLRNSDVALYRAKADGKGRYAYFTNEMNEHRQSRRLMEIELREALEKKDIAVFFQPLIDISTGRIEGCEALVRWKHPAKGYIPPLEFIPLAEETGMIIALGEYVLREACKEAASWVRPIRVAVNMSAVQFRSSNITSLVASILRETGLDADRLEIEITESILIEDKDGMVKSLTSLRELGVRIALDDFGTGYSSLAYLSSFPFDKIKIDRSFVQDIMHRKDSATITRIILNLATSLNMSTVAEGVEKNEELDWLREHGCIEAQGFLFSKAVPARDLRLLLGMKASLRADDNARQWKSA